MDALNLLKKQHREVEALFKKVLEAKEPTERMNLFKQIDRDLRLHAIIEEEIFYPEIRRRAENGDQRLEVAEAYEEHGLVKITIESLEKLTPEPSSIVPSSSFCATWSSITWTKKKARCSRSRIISSTNPSWKK